jgi:hypothetical protein
MLTSGVKLAGSPESFAHGRDRLWLESPRLAESIRASGETTEITCLVITSRGERSASDSQTGTMTWNCIHFERMTPGRRAEGVRVATTPGPSA